MFNIGAMNNSLPKLIITVLTLLVSFISCGPESESSSLNSNNEDSLITLNCDSLIRIALDLIRIDSVEWKMPTDYKEESGHFMRQFRFYQMESIDTAINPFPFQIEVHDSLEIDYIWESRGLDTLFKQGDVDQFYTMNNPIQPECYPKYNFVSRDSIRKRCELYKQDDPRVESYTYYTLSRPLVSKNGQYMLMQFDHNCYGFCGSGHTFLFAKTNTGWVKLWSFVRWIS